MIVYYPAKSGCQKASIHEAEDAALKLLSGRK